MRRLDRQSVPAPGCLTGLVPGKDSWRDAMLAHGPEIRNHLEKLQGRLCAYCESSLDDFGNHVEHLRTRDRFPALTYDWSNLFWCCDRTECCGHYKDTRGRPYDVDDIVDPARDDPDEYFVFHTDGTIGIRRSELTLTQQRRAEETIRVFNLDERNGRLRSMRARAVEAYLARDPDILLALEEWPEAQRRELARGEVESTAGEPFATAIRHLFREFL